ncbi:MAG: twin-arginine translocase TatA/TatE family subunit [Melioribacteraceae bacterium]|nr:twin-arginine translocase TatA/TatE family subunit [Melioribacteraceae bacterium]MCF8265195.1 twin-arginine translocase TatA/TatE family subunit [Melioribacteraceae bacterium]MCF8413766.1 twin-arginine translocase TatA/TatE family subunit [Melioribacteraceae bacterium]
MFGNFGGSELIVVMIAVLILFGAKRIPDIARGIGKGMAEFKKAMRDVENEIQSSINDSDDKNKK